MKFSLTYAVQLPKPLDQDDFGPDDEKQKFLEALDQIALADKVGIDYIFVVEHHFTPEYTHISAPEVFLAAAAGRTQNIRLGTGIIQMPPGHNNPARVAERISLLDCVSNGRVEFGTGNGNAFEVGVFVPDTTDIKEMWREGTRECLRMMTSSPYPGFEGQYFSLPMVDVVPKPAQRPHPPLWQSCVRPPSMAEAAQAGMASLITAFGGPTETKERVDAYWEGFTQGIEPMGRAINPAVMASVNGIIAKTDAEAASRELKGAEFFSYAAPRSFQLIREGGGHINREFQSGRQLDGSYVAATPTTWANPKRMMVGSPDTVRDKLMEYEETNVDIVSWSIQSGERRHEDIMESIELLGTKIMPDFLERHETKHRKWREQFLEKTDLPINASV